MLRTDEQYIDFIVLIDFSSLHDRITNLKVFQDCNSVLSILRQKLNLEQLNNIVPVIHNGYFNQSKLDTLTSYATKNTKKVE